MKKQKLSYLIVSVAVAVALIVYAAYILIGVNPDVLITAQDRNMFSADSLYFSELIARPFGIFQYVGGYLTQYFYSPSIGASLLIAIWIATYFAGVKAFRLKGLWRSLIIIPVACLLTSVVDLGYWVYCLNIHGYWFSQSVAFLCMMLMLWAANSTPRRFRLVWYVLVGFILFPVFGWMSYIFTLALVLLQFRKDDESRTTATWIDGIGVIITIAAPFVFGNFLYESFVTNDVFAAGFPIFKTSTDSSFRPSIPFYVLMGAMLVMSFGRVLPAVRKVPAFAAYLIVGIASAIAVWTAMFKDQNYLYEMQMTQATMNDDWQGVIRVAEKTRTPSRTMVMLKNIALMNTGELGTRSFELGNSGMEIKNPDSLSVNIMQIAAPIIYYNYGKVNFAMRWCMEFAVSYGFSPYYLRNLARFAKTTGENRLAKRYTDRLNKLAYYKEWQPAPTTPIVRELQFAFPDVIDSDENSCERYLISTFAYARNSESPLITELALVYSLILRDTQHFWTSFYDYLNLNKGSKLPTQYEEAYCLFADKSPVQFPLKVNVAPIVLQNYKSFWSIGEQYAKIGLEEDAIGDAMRDSWCGTYWWFNAFGRSAY